jgi:hypothetical protein
MKFLDPYRWAIGAGLVALMIGGALWYRHSLIQEGVERERVKVAEAVAAQKALADAQARNMEEVANEAQARYVQEMAAAKAAADRAAADLARLRNKSASAEQLARASATALGEYAADAERSVDFCAGELARTGETARGASAAAHALYESWPAYTEFQGRLETFKTQLKGQ